MIFLQFDLDSLTVSTSNAFCFVCAVCLFAKLQFLACVRAAASHQRIREFAHRGKNGRTHSDRQLETNGTATHLAAAHRSNRLLCNYTTRSLELRIALHCAAQMLANGRELNWTEVNKHKTIHNVLS